METKVQGSHKHPFWRLQRRTTYVRLWFGVSVSKEEDDGVEQSPNFTGFHTTSSLAVAGGGGS